MSRNMTIPSRPAPPPPQASSNKTNRYSPATNWDDTPFSPQSSATGSSQQHQQRVLKKAPPPRPPPPKVVPALKKPGQPQSINILSNLFGQKRNHGGAKTPITAQKGQIPMKLPPPPKLPPPSGHHNPNYGSLAHTTPTGNGTDMLINFDSPPSSPTFTQKSCSDCISVDSFSSDSNYSSPNNGNMSQAESGFEDDFVSQHESQRSKATTPASSIAATPSSSSALKDLWDLSDPFGMPPSTAAAGAAATSHNGSHYAPVGSATIRAPAVNSKLYEQDFVDPLCNGKTATSRVQTVAMPTIIKAASASGTSSASSSQKSTPVHHDPKPKPAAWKMFPPAPVAPASSASAVGFDDDPEEALDSLPSLPMPNIPPPPPPVCVDDTEEHREPYGVAMYDFNGETDEDLSFRTNDKIYLLKRLNEEWLLGRDRRGCEGMFPSNYIEVRVALPGEHQLDPSPSTTGWTVPTTGAISSSSKHGDISPSATNSFSQPKVRILYTFNAETTEDLTIVENDFVTVLNQISPEWLYGEYHGVRGQFPANFIEYVPPNLPPMPQAINGGV